MKKYSRTTRNQWLYRRYSLDTTDTASPGTVSPHRYSITTQIQYHHTGTVSQHTVDTASPGTVSPHTVDTAFQHRYSLDTTDTASQHKYSIATQIQYHHTDIRKGLDMVRVDDHI